MAVQTRTFPVSKDARIAKSGTYEAGVGADDNLPVGYNSGYLMRCLLSFSADWSDVTTLLKAELKLKTDVVVRVDRGSSPSTYAERLTASWNEGSSTVLSSSNSVTWANQPASTTSGRVLFASSTSSNVWTTVDVTNIVKSWAPASVKIDAAYGGGVGAATTNYGLRLISASDNGSTASAADNQEWWSDEAGQGDPYIVITYDDNLAPRAPVNVLPAAGTIVSTTSGTQITISGSFDDPDDGDYLQSAQAQVYSAATTQSQIDNGTATVIASKTVTPGGTPQTFSVTVTGLPQRTDLQYRVRTRDADGTWGSWTALVAFRTNATPAAPANPVPGTTSSASPGVVDTLTPTFGGTISDADVGAVVAGVEIEVYEDPSAGTTVTKWAYSKTSGFGSATTRFAEDYAGDALEYGKTYRTRSRIQDQDGAWGAWTSWLYFRPVQSVGPSNLRPRDLTTKQSTLTPTLIVGHSANWERYALRVFDNPEGLGTPLWDVPETIQAPTLVSGSYDYSRTYAGAALGQGQTVYWQAAVRLAGGSALGPWSPLFPIYLNALPSAPVLSVAA